RSPVPQRAHDRSPPTAESPSISRYSNTRLLIVNASKHHTKTRHSLSRIPVAFSTQGHITRTPAMATGGKSDLIYGRYFSRNLSPGTVENKTGEPYQPTIMARLTTLGLSTATIREGSSQTAKPSLTDRPGTPPLF